jgi:pimeloyl-ACP methyl ester carboxylesterase
MPPSLVGRYVAPFLGGDGAGHLLALAGALTGDDFADVTLGAIRQRTLVVRGTRDRWCTRAVAGEYVEALPRGHYEHVDEVGHLVPEEDPETLARLILAFLRTAEPEDAPAERFGGAARTLGDS